MGTTSTGPAPDRDFDADALKDWVVQRSKPLSIGAAAVIVGAAAFLFWQQSNRIKNERADAALGTAQSAYYSGNTTLAKSDLDKVATRYPGTASGTQATLLLAAIAYGEAKYDDGIKLLTAAQATAPALFAAEIEEMIGAGYADSKRYDEAAAHYLKSADRSQFPADKDVMRAEAARAYGMGGKSAEARKIWAQLAADRESPVMNEAKVRLGELDAKVASK
jgi:predicted negative regulator of RcsB-dependent stress response